VILCGWLYKEIIIRSHHELGISLPRFASDAIIKLRNPNATPAIPTKVIRVAEGSLKTRAPTQSPPAALIVKSKAITCSGSPLIAPVVDCFPMIQFKNVS